MSKARKEAKRLRKKIADDRKGADHARERLRALVNECAAQGHQWGPVKLGTYAYQGPYNRDAGGPTTAYGSKWTRKCKSCGFRQSTTDTKERAVTLRELCVDHGAVCSGKGADTTVVVVEPFFGSKTETLSVFS